MYEIFLSDLPLGNTTPFLDSVYTVPFLNENVTKSYGMGLPLTLKRFPNRNEITTIYLKKARIVSVETGENGTMLLVSPSILYEKRVKIKKCIQVLFGSPWSI